MPENQVNDVKLPNGKIIKNVPVGTPKEQRMAKAIAAGLATEQDFTSAVNPTPAPVEAEQVQQPVSSIPSTGTPQTDIGLGIAETAATVGSGIATSIIGGFDGLYEGAKTILSGGTGQEALDNAVKAAKSRQATHAHTKNSRRYCWN